MLSAVFAESSAEFTVDARSVTSKGEGKVVAVLNTPSGARTSTLVKNKGDGTYDVSYTPMNEGMLPHR